MTNRGERSEHRASRKFAIAQSVLLVAYVGAFVLDAGPRILDSGIARAAGAVLCALGLVLMICAIVSLRRVIQVAPEPRPGAHLVTHGVYSRFRHPIYTAIVILVIGLFLRKPAASVAIASAVTIAFFIVKVRIEERMLLARYPEYAEYKRRTLGIVPWLSS